MAERGRGARARSPRACRGCGRRTRGPSAGSRPSSPAAISSAVTGPSAANSASSTSRRADETRRPRARRGIDGSGTLAGASAASCGTVMRAPRAAPLLLGGVTAIAHDSADRGSSRSAHATCGTALRRQHAADADDQQRRDGRQRGRRCGSGHVEARRARGRRRRRRGRAPVSVIARPALKATISTIPSAIWPWATAPSSTTSADGHGIRPAAAPIASMPRHESRSRRRGVLWPWSWSWSWS